MGRIPFGGKALQGPSISANVGDTPEAGALKGVGNVLAIMGPILGQHQKENDQLALQKAVVDMKAADNDALHNGETGYLYRNGEVAINTAKEVYQAHVDNVQKIASRFEGRPDLAKQFSLAADQNSVAFSRTVMDHYGRQKNKLANDQLNTMLTQGNTSMLTLYNDPVAQQAMVESTINSAHSTMKNLGVPDGKVDVVLHQAKNDMYESSLKGWVANTVVSGGSLPELEKSMRGSLAFNQVDEPTQQKYIKQLQIATARQNAEDRTNLNIELDNANKSMQNGEPYKIAQQESDFIRVYGEAEGKQKWKGYQVSQEVAPVIQGFSGLPNSELVKHTKYFDEAGNPTFVKTNGTDGVFPETNDPYYSVKIGKLRVLDSAARRVLNARNSDQVLQGQVEGRISQIDWADVTSVPDALTKRYAEAGVYASDIGAKNFKMLSKDDQNILSNGLSKMAPTEKVNFLKTIAIGFSGNPEGYRALMHEVGENNPAYSTAGDLLANQAGYTDHTNGWAFWQTNTRVNGEAATKYIFSGLEAQKPTDKGGAGRKLGNTTNEAFNSYFEGELYQGGTGAIALAAASQTARAYYIGKSIEQGAYSNLDTPDTALMKEAVEITSGKTSTKYSVKAPLGMPVEILNDRLNAGYNAYATANGMPTTANGADLSDYNLVPSRTPGGTNDGRYFLQVGNKYLHDRKGNPVVLDVRKEINPPDIQDIPE